MDKSAVTVQVESGRGFVTMSCRCVRWPMRWADHKEEDIYSLASSFHAGTQRIAHTQGLHYHDKLNLFNILYIYYILIEELEWMSLGPVH